MYRATANTLDESLSFRPIIGLAALDLNISCRKTSLHK
jgi:hypothetical protein